MKDTSTIGTVMKTTRYPASSATVPTTSTSRSALRPLPCSALASVAFSCMYAEAPVSRAHSYAHARMGMHMGTRMRMRMHAQVRPHVPMCMRVHVRMGIHMHMHMRRLTFGCR